MKKNLLLGMFLSLFLTANAEVDPNFYIYLCFGQSNMEGNASPQSIDKSYVDEHFQTLACVNFDNTTPPRVMGEWYTAYPPIVRPGTNLGVADYFGRTMVAALPSNVRVGVVDVAIGGTKIEGFFSELVEDYIKPEADWLKAYFAAYDNDPYQRLVDMAKIAQQSGVIKGILLHQGESNNMQTDWPQKVKTVYERLLNDLGLNAEDVPLFVGETLRKTENQMKTEEKGGEVKEDGACRGHNSVIATVPSVIPNSYVISSKNCPGQADGLHFTAAGYRMMGMRYASEALRLMGKEMKMDPEYNMPDNLAKFFTPKKFETTIEGPANKSLKLKLICTFKDNHKEDLVADATFTSDYYTISNAKRVKIGEEGTAGIVTAKYIDFMGKEWTVELTVGTPGATSIKTVKSKKANSIVYDLRGMKKGTTEQWEGLAHGAYVVDGKLIVK